MRRYLSVISSFFIMLSIGNIYGWSIIASNLIQKHNFSSSLTQLIFGLVIFLFPITMLVLSRIENKISYKKIALFSGILFFIGYIIAGLSNGNFYLMVLGIGVLGGVATGLGYWVTLTSSIGLFPEKKGLITGIITAGFAISSFLYSGIVVSLLLQGFSIFSVLEITGILYGSIIIILSFFIVEKEFYSIKNNSIDMKEIIKNSYYRKLFIGIFLGTFAGLMIIGNLSILAKNKNIPDAIIVISVGYFAIMNFFGRIIWGFVSDKIRVELCIKTVFLLQGISLLFLLFESNEILFLIIITIIATSYGSNFVLYAKQTADYFGVNNTGIIYPFIFIGYGIAGLIAPFIAGYLNDILKNYDFSLIISFLLSLIGFLLFLKNTNSQLHS